VSGLIEQLNQHGHLAPDEIVKRLHNNGWVRWIHMSRDFYEQHVVPNPGTKLTFAWLTYRSRWSVITTNHNAHIQYYSDLEATKNQFGLDNTYWVIPTEDHERGQFPYDPLAETDHDGGNHGA
jgi:hypothetical protein